MANKYDAPIFEGADGTLYVEDPSGDEIKDIKPTGLTLAEVQKRAQQRIVDEPSLSKTATRLLLGVEQGAASALPRAIGGGFEFAGGILPDEMGGPALRRIGREAREGASQIGQEYEDLGAGAGGGGVAEFAQGLGASVVPSATALLAAAPLGVLGAGEAAVVTGSAVASGLQSLGGTFADAFEANKKRGMSDEEAYRKSYTPAVLSGLATGLITKGFGGTGLEPILLGKAVPKGFAAAVKAVAKDVGMEALEEATDEAWQSAIRSATYNPEATAKENLENILKAGISGGLMAGVVQGTRSAPSAISDAVSRKPAATPPPLPSPAPAAPVAPTPVPTPQVAAPQASQRVSTPVEPPPMPKVSGLMLNQPLSTWSASPSSPNILAQSPDSFGIGNKVVKLSQAGGGFGKVGTVTAMTGPKVDGNPNATVTVKFDDGTTTVSGFKEFGFLENVQQAKAMSEAARGKPFEFPLPPPSPKVALPEPPAKVDSKRTVPLDAAEQLQQRINVARAAGDVATARKLAGELDMLGVPPAATPKPRRTAITPAAQAAAPKRTATLPEVPSLPEPLEGQPYDTRLTTRPEATMPARPVGELGIERGRVSPVDPDLVAAVDDIRGGYAERTARGLEREAAPANQMRGVVGSDGGQRKMDQPIGTRYPTSLTPSLSTEEVEALRITQLKGVSDRGDGIFFIPEKVMTATRRKAVQRGGRNIEVKAWADVTGNPSDRGYAILDRRARNAARTPSPQPPYATQEQAPVEVLRNQPPGTPAPVAEGKPGEVSQAAGEGAKEARDKSKPEQMTPGEFSPKADPINQGIFKSKKEASDRLFQMAETIRSSKQMSGILFQYGLKPEDAYEIAKTEGGKWSIGATHKHRVATAFLEKKPVSTSAVDTYGIKLPPGYIREGELYVYRPEGKSEQARGATPQEGIGSIYQMDRRGETKWLVQQGEKRGFGDSIFDTEQEAVAESQREAARREQRAESLRKMEAEKDAEAKAKAEREDLGTFTDGMSPMKRGAVVKQLTARFRYLGKEMSRRDIIRELVNQGRKVETEDGQRVLSNDKDEYLGEKVLTKAGLDYAEHLIRERDAQMSLGQTPSTDVGEQQVLDEIAKLKSVTGPLNSSERIDLNELRLSAQNKKLSRLSQAYLENLEERARGAGEQASVAQGRLKQVLGSGAVDALAEAKSLWPKEQDYSRAGLQRLKETVVIGVESALSVSRPQAIKIAEDLIEGRKTILDKMVNLEPIREREIDSIGSFPSVFTKWGYERGERKTYSHPRYSKESQSEQLSLGSTPIARPAPSLSKMQVEQAVRELFDGNTPPNFQVTHNYGKTFKAKFPLGTFDGATLSSRSSQAPASGEPVAVVLKDGSKVGTYDPNTGGLAFTESAPAAGSELFFQQARTVRGWYDADNGTIWLNAAYLRSPQEARAVFIEEAFHAIQNDKTVQTELSRLVASLTPEQISSAKAAYGNISEEQLRMEAVADILEQQQLTQEQRGILARLWDAVLGAVQRLYGKFTGKVFTERDAQDVLAKALKAAAVGKRSLQSGGEVYAEGGLAAKAKAFFSRLFRTVEQSQQNKASGAQWKATIKNSKLGANLDEMALVGVNDLEDGKVYSRQEVLDYLQANQVEVKDVTLGEKTLSGKWETLKDGKSWRRKIANRWTHVWEQSDGRAIGQGPSKYNRWFPSAQAAKDYFDSSEVSAAELPTHFSTYQLPGAKEGSYREVLLTVPGQTTKPKFKVIRFGDAVKIVNERDGSTAWYGENVSEADSQLLKEKYEQAIQPSPLTWADGHAQYQGVKNPIVRLRFNERTTQDGKRMLFLEEVQAPQKGEFEKMPALFQKNWREIAFKWALRHAAENGFEVVGWTTGAQQADRYSLSKQLDSVKVLDASAKGRTGFDVTGYKDGRAVVVKSNLPLEQLESEIGKDLARKVSEDYEGTTGNFNKTYSGLDLEIGGEGLKKLYDVDFRNVVGKLPAVRNAGGKVGSSKIHTGDAKIFTQPESAASAAEIVAGGGRIVAESGNSRHVLTSREEVATYADAGYQFFSGEQFEQVNSIPITPAIADSVMGGQAMFSTGSPQNQLDQQYFEAIQRGDMQEVQRLVEEAADRASFGAIRTMTDYWFRKYGSDKFQQEFTAYWRNNFPEQFADEADRDPFNVANDVAGNAFESIASNEKITPDELQRISEAALSKSADPITRDDSGNIIPLSQRFQQESPDIRYSLGAPVSQSDATEVQGRAIEPSVIAAASRSVADLGRQTVEGYEQAGRQLEGLAYESKQFRQARSELNNLVKDHDGLLQQRYPDRADLRTSILEGVSVENGQIVVSDALVTKLAQMGLQFRPELVRAMQAEIYFEQQARRLVDTQEKRDGLIELRDYYQRIKAPDEEVVKLSKMIAAKQKVITSISPVTTQRGGNEQSMAERASEIKQAEASKVELQSKRDALNLEPVQEFFGKGITELRDLSEKAKAAADLTRALMDSTTSISEVARLGEIYDQWAGFDATVKDALKQGTLTEEQRVSVLTSLQQSFNEFDEAKFRMDDLLNSEEKGLLKDIRESESEIADAKVNSGMADILVADALKAAKGEMGLTGTVGDAANIANLEKSTSMISTLAENLGKSLDQNRWLYDFLMAPGDMPAFGASVAASLNISEDALREVLRVVQKSPSLASAIVTIADHAASKWASSPPVQMESIAKLATSGNPLGMAIAANLTSKIVQQANSQGTAAKAVQKAAAAKLAQSVLRLRTLQQGQALFNQTANSPAFQQLRGAVATGASEAQKMVVLGPTGPVLRGFKSAAKEYQPELKINVESDALELQKTRDKVWKYLQNAEQYVEDYEATAAAHAANPANPSPSQLGFDVADYNGLKFAIENQIWPMFLNMGDMDDAARAGQYLTPVAVRKLMKAPAFIGEVFKQYEQVGKMIGGFAGNTFRQQIANYKRGYTNAKRVASQFQDLPKLQSAAMQSHNIRSEDTYRDIFNEMAHYGRLFGSPLRAGFTLPISNQTVTKADMEFFNRTLAFEEKLRREVTEIDPVTGVRYMRNGKEITRKGAYVGDKGMPRHLNRDATQFIADVTNAYTATPKGFTTGTDLSASSADEVVKYWNQHLNTLKQHILDSLRTDRSFKQTAEMAAAEKKIAARWLAGNMDQVNSVQDLVDLIAAEIPATTGRNPADVAVQGLNNELLQYVAHAERIQKERADDNAKTSGLSIALSSDNEFTKPAAYLELPSEYYDYGALTSIDRITAQSRANHSSLVDFANSLRLAIKELENRMGRLQKATTDKEREAILENYKGNPQEMEDVLQLLKSSLKDFEDSYRAGGPDIIPTKLGQKLLKATVGSVLAKVEIAFRNLSQGQIQVLTNAWALNYMSARLAAWKALSNVPRGVVNTGYLVARNVAGFADRRLGRDPQFQRTLKGAVDMVADGIFKSAQAALLKPRVGAANVRASFERVQNLGFDISDDWWESAKQAWRESGQFRTQLEENEAGKSRATWAANFIGRLANTGADAASAFVRGSVLEASDLNMNALSLGLVGNMEQRLQEVATVFGKRLTDAGITEIDPANKDSMLKASEWLPSMNQQTAANSLAEIRKFLESSASSEGFSLEKNLLQYYQDKVAGKPARMFNQRTFDAVQRSMIAENNAALPTNRASAGQASQLWRTMLTLTGYPADAMLKLLRVSTGGSRDRKVVLQAASKMTAAIGFAAMAILFQGAGDAGSELWKRKMQGKKPDRVTPLDADFWNDPVHMSRTMGRYLLMSAYFLGDFLQGAYGWVDGKSTIDPTQRAFVISTASQILRDIASGANIRFVKGGTVQEALTPLRKTISRLALGVPELENLLGMERDSTEAARKAMAENARANGIEVPTSGFRGVIGLTNIKRKALSQAVSDMEIAKRNGDTEGYNKAKAAAQKQVAELEAYYLKQRLEAGDSPEVAARTAKNSVWADYQENNPVTAALGGKRPSAEQYKQLVENSTGERGEVIRQGIKAWQDGAQALFGKPGSITKEDVAENRPSGTVREPSYGRVSLTGGVSGRMRSVGTVPPGRRRAKIRRVSLTGRRRKIGPMRSRRKKIRRVRLTA